MDRRGFIKHSIIGASALSALAANAMHVVGSDSQVVSELTAGEVQAHLRSLGAEWIDPQKTVDTFKAGDPDLVVKGIAVGWMSYSQSLREAYELGCNLFITHEPTYYDHMDRDQTVFAFEAAAKKREYIQDKGMVIVRCHDVWDRVPEMGIRDAWASFLGLTKELARRMESDSANGRPFCGVYEIQPQTAEQLARQVAGKLAGLQQAGVQLIGPPGKTVSRVAIGTGAITPFRQMVRELQADVAICSDDGFSYWRDGAFAIDMEYPVIVVNHPCSEEVGMRRLAGHLADQFPQVPVHHMSQSCMYQTITANPAT